MSQSELDKLREDWRRPGLIEQHQPKQIAKYIDGLFSYSSIRHGDSKRGQGDIVIINCKSTNDLISLRDYLEPILFIDRIEIVGIFTNIYFTREFFGEVMKLFIN